VDHARMAIQAGKHVLVEKPFSYSSADATKLLKEARATGIPAPTRPIRRSVFGNGNGPSQEGDEFSARGLGCLA
jgi:hypothetical protein